MYDYHVHSCFSSDSSAPMEEIIDVALREGIQEICFTDHIEFDEGYALENLFDLEAYAQQVEALNRKYSPDLVLRKGVEIGLKDTGTFAVTTEHIARSNVELDFIIGSVHYTEAGNAYYPEFFEGLCRQRAYSLYLEYALPRFLSASDYDVIGHFDYPAKKAPYEDRAIHYADNPDVFDCLFKHLVQNGIGLEINTSPYLTEHEAFWGQDVLSRYVELGGEFITIGSDAHVPKNTGWRAKDAIRLAKASGVPYIATFNKRKAIMHRLSEIPV